MTQETVNYANEAVRLCNSWKVDSRLNVHRIFLAVGKMEHPVMRRLGHERREWLIHFSRAVVTANASDFDTIHLAALMVIVKYRLQ